jgi:hypothetical protein
MTRIRGLLVVVAAAIAVALWTPSVEADGGWLDQQPLVQWNRARMTIPQAPQDPGTDPRCAQQARPADTDQDRELVRAGWHLFGPYIGGWDMLVIRAGSSYDGMCRPNGYQYFVFVHGIFAGTVSPNLMDARTDGSANDVYLFRADEISVVFNRYAANDALCCPSRLSTANYRINRSGGAPVLVVTDVSTESTMR